VTQIRAVLAESQSSHAQLKAAAEMLPGIQAELAQFERDYALEKRQYDNLVRRRETVSMSTRSKTPDWRNSGSSTRHGYRRDRGPNRYCSWQGSSGRRSQPDSRSVSSSAKCGRRFTKDARCARSWVVRCSHGQRAPEPGVPPAAASAALLFCRRNGHASGYLRRDTRPAYLGIRVSRDRPMSLIEKRRSVSSSSGTRASRSGVHRRSRLGNAAGRHDAERHPTPQRMAEALQSLSAAAEVAAVRYRGRNNRVCAAAPGGVGGARSSRST